MGHSLPKHEPIRLLAHQDEPPRLIMPTRNGSSFAATNGNGHAGQIGQETPFHMWKRTNVVPQKQDGYVTAAIKLFMGDITSEQMLWVADLAERHSNGNLRTTINQNLVIRWIPEDRIESLYDDLSLHGLADPGAELVEDIIACPGTDTCGLGITSSKGLAAATIPARSTTFRRSACTGSVNAWVTMSPRTMSCIWADQSTARPVSAR
jgi:sulfite reductase (ferredoxin)